MMITLLLFSFLALAEDMASEKYCFANHEQSILAKQKIISIQVASDIVTPDENCLVVQMRSHRRELIQRFILTSFPNTSIPFSSESTNREPCRLKVEKVSDNQTNEKATQLGHSFSANQTTKNSARHESMQVVTLNDFNLSIDQDEIMGNCRFINSNRYEISLVVRKNPISHLPDNLSPGSIVNMPLPPPDQETMTIQTQLQLERGEKVEVGNIIRSIRGKSNQVQIKPTLNAGAKKISIHQKVFLMIQ